MSFGIRDGQSVIHLAGREESPTIGGESHAMNMLSARNISDNFQRSQVYYGNIITLAVPDIQQQVLRRGKTRHAESETRRDNKGLSEKFGRHNDDRLSLSQLYQNLSIRIGAGSSQRKGV